MSCSGWDTHLGKVHSLTIVPKTNLQINGNRFKEHTRINQASTAKGQEISEAIFLGFSSSEQKMIFFKMISALASKMGQIKK